MGSTGVLSNVGCVVKHSRLAAPAVSTCGDPPTVPMEYVMRVKWLEKGRLLGLLLCQASLVALLAEMLLFVRVGFTILSQNKMVL